MPLKLCSSCDNLKPTENFDLNSNGKPRKQCLDCRSLVKKTYYTANTDVFKSRQHKYRSHNAEKIKSQILWTRYHLTPDDIIDLLLSQDNRCAICKTSDSGRRKWHVDHDHSCCPGQNTCGMCVRGLLCGKCNAGLGMFKENIDSLNNAINYLQKDK